MLCKIDIPGVDSREEVIAQALKYNHRSFSVGLVERQGEKDSTNLNIQCHWLTVGRLVYPQSL